MHRRRALQQTLVCLTILPLWGYQPAQAGDISTDVAPQVVDVALNTSGLLVGQVVDPQGKGLPRTAIALYREDQLVAAAQTDGEGYFSVTGLRAGVYRIEGAGRRLIVRLWRQGQAPPFSQAGILVVADRHIVRGQIPCPGPLHFWLSNPWVLTGAATAAVAVPIAVHSSQRPCSP